MSTEARLDSLLERWEEARERGGHLTPEELCADCPELIESLRSSIAGQEDTNAGLAGTTDPGAEPADPQAPILAPAVAELGGLRPLARGALGEIFLARDHSLGREVAVKLIQRGRAGDAVLHRRFLHEAEVTARLEHPGIVPVYGRGLDAEGRPYYAMRRIEGQTLGEAIGRFHQVGEPARAEGERRLAFRRLLGQFVSICETIAYAHGRGVIHRDLKPSNIMLGPYGETLVVDWGLAKQLGGEDADLPTGPEGASPRPAHEDLTATGAVLGTPQYMSPEQARGEPAGPASDIFSLGLVLYAILTGGSAFEKLSLRGLDPLKSVREAAIVPLRRRTPNVPRALEAICLQALAARPEDRYTTARALAEDVTRWLADEPVTAHPEGWNERLARWARRNRTAVVGVTFAVLVGLATVAGVQARSNAKLTKARDETTRALAEATEAKKRTDAALAESEESRKQAEAVSTFLTGVFRSPDPSQDGRTIKVVNVLDRAAEELDKRFDGSMATKGALLDALGRTSYGLGLFDRAEEWHAKARAVRESALGAHHPDTLRSCTGLAVAISGNRPAESISLLEATLKRFESVLGPDHLDTLRCRTHLANAISYSRPAEAIALLQGSLKVLETKFGPDHPDTLESRNDLALAYDVAGRADDAIPLHEATLKALEAKLGPDHNDTLTSRNNLALAYHNAGRAADAIPLHEATFKALEIKLGPDHPNTLGSRHNLAIAYFATGRTTDALLLQEGTVKLWDAKLGPDHPNTLASRHNLAHLYYAAGRTTQAIALHEATLEARETKLVPDHPSRLESLNSLAGAYESLGRWSAAEALRRDALARRRRSEKPDSSVLAGDLVGLGRNLLNQARWSVAEPVLREGLSIYTKAQPGTWQRFHAMSLLGGALLGQGRHAEAEPLVVQGCEGVRAFAARIPASLRISRLAEASERVVRLYEGWGRPEQAAEWKRKLALCDLPTDVFARP
jgi:non-specific serine/threonine protein kinase/serine/threonine-protein kinase